jgi:hypothetical protein
MSMRLSYSVSVRVAVGHSTSDLIELGLQAP